MFCVACSAVGCTSTYELNNAVSANQKLKPGMSGYVAMAADGRFENNSYAGSGNKTALILVGVLKPRLEKIEIAPEVVSYEQSLAAAKKGDFDYLFLPKILHWEDRATEWSGKNDRVQIELRTVDVHTGETLDVGDFKGVSKWATFGGDVPEDLLKVPMTQYVNYLYGADLPKSQRVRMPDAPHNIR